MTGCGFDSRLEHHFKKLSFLRRDRGLFCAHSPSSSRGDENPSAANASERRPGFERTIIVYHDVSSKSKCRRRHFAGWHRLSGARSTHTKCVYHASSISSFRRRKLADPHRLSGARSFPPHFFPPQTNHKNTPSTASRGRTGTNVTIQRILNPSRLPIPPWRHTWI